jgi:hypothetical protein
MSLEEIEAAIHEAAVEVGLFDSTFAYCGYAHCGYSVDGTYSPVSDPSILLYYSMDLIWNPHFATNNVPINTNRRGGGELYSN